MRVQQEPGPPTRWLLVDLTPQQHATQKQLNLPTEHTGPGARNKTINDFIIIHHTIHDLNTR